MATIPDCRICRNESFQHEPALQRCAGNCQFITPNVNFWPNAEQYRHIANGQYARPSIKAVDYAMDSGEAYDLRPVNNKSPGYCLIVNVEKDRRGSIYDRFCLETIFHNYYGMHVENLTDPSRDEFFQYLDDNLFHRKDIEKFRCFILVLMAHGERDRVFLPRPGSKSEQEVRFQELLDKLSAWQKMRGLPKIVIANSCEVPKVDCTKAKDLKPNTEKRPPQNSQFTVDTSLADLMFVRATQGPVKAARHIFHGAMFIQALCEVLKRQAASRSLTDMISEVTRLMGLLKVQTSIYSEFELVVQIPSIRYCTTKTFFLYCKETCTDSLNRKDSNCLLVINGWEVDERWNVPERAESTSEALLPRTGSNGTVDEKFESLAGPIVSSVKGDITYVFETGCAFYHSGSLYGFKPVEKSFANVVRYDLASRKLHDASPWKHKYSSNNFAACQLDDDKSLLVTTGGRDKDGKEVLDKAAVLDTTSLQIEHKANEKYKTNSKQKIFLETYSEVKWIDMKPMKIARFNHAITSFGHRLFVTGGCLGPPSNAQTDSTEIIEYDTNGTNGSAVPISVSFKSSEWKQGPPLNNPRHSHSSVVFEGKVFVVGGYQLDSDGNSRALSSVEYLDEKENKWVESKPLNHPRYSFSLAVFDNKLYAIGGLAGKEALSSCEVLDNSTSEWRVSDTLKLTPPRYNTAVVTVPQRFTTKT